MAEEKRMNDNEFFFFFKEKQQTEKQKELEAERIPLPRPNNPDYPTRYLDLHQILQRFQHLQNRKPYFLRN